MRFKVLVVDDASFVRMMIRQILLRLGYNNILEAKNGFEAVRFYKENKPDLTILDITMPELDGFSALKEIMSFDPGAKVIMCSAVSQETIVREALEFGAIDFLAKPFRPVDIKKIIIKYFGPNSQ
jgi:two-component system chemotaxis response regulator CheY